MYKPSAYAYMGTKSAATRIKEAEKNIGAGDPFFCSECRVCLNKNSRILTKA
jgi:hypothetical protein